MAVNVAGWELLSRFIVFIGKPARSENSEFEAKYQCARKMFAFDDSIVLCGDSPMKLDFYPELVAAKLSRFNDHIKVVDLALSDGTQTDAVRYLQYLLDRKINLKLVVYNFESVKAASQFDLDEQSAAARSKTYLANGVLSRPNGFEKSLPVWLSDNFYLSMYRLNLKRYLEDALTIVSSPKRFQEKSFYEPHNTSLVEFTRAGMSPDYRISSAIGQTGSQDNKNGDQPAQTPPAEAKLQSSAGSSLNGGAYSTIVSFCQRNNLPLLITWLPEQSSIIRKGFYQAPYTEAWFKQKFESYGNNKMVKTLDLNYLPENCGGFLDCRNLNAYGAIKNSENFAEAMLRLEYRVLIENTQAAKHTGGSH